MTSALTVYEPTNLDQALAMSERLAKSALVPAAFRGKPSDIFLVLAGGKELGFSMVQSLRSFYVINGRLGMYTDAMIAVCVGKPCCKYFRLIESTDDKATYETQRDGSEPVRLSYTIEQAKRSGLTSNQNYNKHPAAMLRARCGAALARIVYPDYLAGVYDPAEFDDEEQAVKQARPVQAVIEPRPALPPQVVQATVDVEMREVREPVIQPDDVVVAAALTASTEASGEYGKPNWTEKEPDFNRAESERLSSEAKLLAALEKVMVPSGPAKGQFVSAQPLVWLQNAQSFYDDLKSGKLDGKKPTMKDLKTAEAVAFYLDIRMKDEKIQTEAT